MGYVIGQFSKRFGDNLDNDFLTSGIITGTAATRDSTADFGVTADEQTKITFKDQCCNLNSILDIETNYYFHGKIKRLSNSDQTFIIKLVNNSNSNTTAISNINNNQQFIKRIVVGKTSEGKDDWVDVEFIFQPLNSYNCILFELQRIPADLTVENGREAIIIYQELSIINNIINKFEDADNIKKGLIKIGVQSRPGLFMCINGEEIRTSRTGVYELKNGIITVSFFSVINAADESFDPTITKSQCDFGEKTRTIDSFTLDYIYKE